MVLDSICVQNFHYLMVMWVKKGITGVDMSSFTHIDKKKKDNLIFDIGPTQGLNDIILTVEGQYSINFSGSYKEFCLSCIIMGATVYLLMLQNYIN